MTENPMFKTHRLSADSFATRCPGYMFGSFVILTFEVVSTYLVKSGDILIWNLEKDQKDAEILYPLCGSLR